MRRIYLALHTFQEFHADLLTVIILKPQPEITSQNFARARHLFLKPNLGPKTKFVELVKICATAGTGGVAKHMTK